jgi:large subunit ribosomal protein L24
MRPGAHSRQGGIVEKENPINITNLMVVCGKCTDPTRVGRRVLEDGSRVRYCKKCDEIIE